MLFGIVKGPTYDLALKKMQKAEPLVSGFEIRLDCFDKIDFGAIESLVKRSSLPCIFTLRKKSQGGAFRGSEEERLALIEQLLSLRPPFFDLEYDTAPRFLEKAKERTKILLSYHNFEQTPDLNNLLQSMQSPHVHGYKIACHAKSSLDALRMLLFVKENAEQGKRVIGISLGEKGTLTRVLAPVVGNILTYAALDPHEREVGQLLLDEFTPKLSTTSSIYALIGDPVENSRSHITHNLFFREQKQDAVYVKILLSSDELKACFSFFRALPFMGLSVTMPHKEAIIPFLDTLTDEAEESSAVNTVLFSDGKVVGHNTDGRGALDALEAKTPVKNKRILLLGAGGTARAIAFEAKRRGAELVIVNRTALRAKKLAEELGGFYFALADISLACSQGYDILIHATSVGMTPNADALILTPENLLPNKVVMDVVSHPKNTRLLQEAEKKGCTLVYGEELFVRQAQGQFAFWSLV